MRRSLLIFTLLLSAHIAGQGQTQVDSQRQAMNSLCASFSHPNVDAAINHANSAVLWQPDLAAGYFRLGQLYELKKEPQKANINFTRAIEATLINRGRLKASNGDFDGAIKDLTEAIKMTPDVPKKKETFGTNLAYLALFHRGLTYAEMDTYDNAFKDLAAATEWYPGFAEAHYNMGLLRNLLGDSKAAIGHTETALKLIQEKLGDGRATAGDNEMVLKLKGDYKDASVSLGFFHQKQGQWKKAEETYRAALRYAPDDPDLLNLLGTMLVRQNLLQDALFVLQKASESKPDDATFLSDFASALILSKRLQDARQKLERALSIDPENPSVHERLGDLHLQLGQTEDALTSYQKAVDYSEENDAAGKESRVKKLRDLMSGGGQRPRTLHDN